MRKKKLEPGPGQTQEAGTTVGKDWLVASGDIRDITERKRAEEVLRESESILRSFFDAPGDMRGIVEVVAPDDVRHVADNTVTAGYLGLTPVQMRGKLGSELGEPPEILRTWIHYYEKSRRMNGPVSFGYCDKRGDSHEAWLWVTVSYLSTNPQGEPRFAYVVQDITERKRAEKELRQAGEMFEKTFHGNAAAMVLAQMTDGRVLEVNNSWLELTGLRREEVIGKTTLELGVWANPEERDEITLEVQQHGAVHGRELHLHGKDEERIVLFYAQGISLRGEQVLISSALDITDRKRAEKELAGLASFPILNPNPIIETDLNGNLLYINPSAQTMFPDLQERGQGHPFIVDVKNVHFKANHAQCEVMVGQRWYHQTIERIDKLQRLRVYGLDITERRQAEEALRESEHRFRTMVNAIPQLAWIAKADGYIYWYNQRWYEYTGTTPEQMEGWGWRSVHDPHALPEVMARWKTSIATGEPFNMIFPLRRADGVFRSFLTRIMPLKDERGSVRNWFGTNTDVTEQKQTEEALRESSNRFKVLTENINAGVALVDEHGDFTIVNPAFLRIFDLPDQSDIKNINDRDWSKWQVFDESGELLDVDEHPVREAAITGKAVQHRLVGVKSPVGGSLKWILISAEPMLKADGRMEALICTYHDLTERKHTEKALRESEEIKRAAEVLASSEKEFRLLAEAMPQIVWTTRPDGWNTYFNHQWVDYTGLTLEKSYGHGWNIPFHPEDQQRAWDAWQNAVTNLASYSLECRLRRADGVYRWWLIRGVPVLDEKGKILKWFGTCTDIEDLKRTEEALWQANADLEQRAAQLRALAGELTLSEQRERSRLAKVLHDHLQQLLVAAKFRTTILGRLGDDVVKQASREVEELIDESIASSRSLTAELSPPILREAGLNEGLQWLARRMADTQGLFVDLELNDSGPLPEDIKVLLFESVRELLFNVVKHANTRSAAVNLRRLEGSLQVTVSDQGVGFDPSAMPMVGEGGRGFGLFTIRERLGLMGGRFEIQSNPDQGSRFVLSVPVTAPVVKEPKLQGTIVLPKGHLMAASDYPDPGRKIRVMLADDHAVVRQGIANLLADESDIDVVGEATNGQEAVDLAARLLPDVILMDVSMPKLNGVEATRAIRNEYPAIRIIGLSMFEDIERAQAMRDAGAVDYLTKSGSADVLINAIRTSIQTS